MNNSANRILVASPNYLTQSDCYNDATNEPTGGDNIGPDRSGNIRVLMRALRELRAENIEDHEAGTDPELIADTTCYFAAQFIVSLPDSLNIPSLDVDCDGNIEFEWSKGRASFSIYITDTTKVIYAGAYSRSEYVSGSFTIEECEIRSLIIAHINRVFAHISIT